MKLKYTFEAVHLGEDTVYVPVGNKAKELNGVLKLNAEGYMIAEMLRDHTSENDIVTALANRYDNDRKQIAGFVHSFITALSELNLLEE